MALDAVSLMRARVRGTPSWPGHDPETGYVGADRSDHSQKLLADGAGHTFLTSTPTRLRANSYSHRRAGMGCVPNHEVSPKGAKVGQYSRIWPSSELGH